MPKRMNIPENYIDLVNVFYGAIESGALSITPSAQAMYLYIAHRYNAERYEDIDGAWSFPSGVDIGMKEWALQGFKGYNPVNRARSELQSKGLIRYLEGGPPHNKGYYTLLSIPVE